MLYCLVDYFVVFFFFGVHICCFHLKSCVACAHRVPLLLLKEVRFLLQTSSPYIMRHYKNNHNSERDTLEQFNLIKTGYNIFYLFFTLCDLYVCVCFLWRHLFLVHLPYFLCFAFTDAVVILRWRLDRIKFIEFSRPIGRPVQFSNLHLSLFGQSAPVHIHHITYTYRFGQQQSKHNSRIRTAFGSPTQPTNVCSRIICTHAQGLICACTKKSQLRSSVYMSVPVHVLQRMFVL